MSRTVVLTVTVEEGVRGDFITGKPVVVDARPEPWLWAAWRRFAPRLRKPLPVPPASDRLGVLAGPETFALLSGAEAKAGVVDLILRSPQGQEELNV